MPSLDASVDANTLRVADLRRILHEHEIAVPSGARKAALVESFNTYVRPKLGATSRSAEQIQKVTPRKRTGTPRRSREVNRESYSSSHTPVSKREPEVDMVGTPEIKFSDENPFQSMSPARTPTASPLSREDTHPIHTSTSPSKLRHIVSASDAKDEELKQESDAPVKDRSPWTGRRTEDAEEAPKEPLRKSSLDTPTRSSEQARVLATHPRSAVQYRHSGPQGRSFRPSVTLREALSNWRTTLLRWTLWISAFVWLYYCHRTRVVGFCVGSRPSEGTLAHPVCLPCPDHGVCQDRKLVACDSEYIAEASGIARIPLVSYAVPFGWTAPQCVPDTYKLILAAEMSDAIVEYLAHWHGQVQCGRAAPHEGAPNNGLGRFALPAIQVQETLLDRVDESIDAATFAAVWDLATTGLKEHAPSEFVQLGLPGELWFASERASMPLVCRVRLYVLDLIWKGRVRVTAAVLILTFLWGLLLRVRQARKRRVHVAKQVQRVYERLQEQAQRHAAGEGPLEVPSAHLRDEILHAEPDTRARRQQWVRVAHVVEQNANVRTRQAQWHGEWQRVWEWVGLTPSLGSPPKVKPADAPFTAAAADVSTAPADQGAMTSDPPQPPAD